MRDPFDLKKLVASATSFYDLPLQLMQSPELLSVFVNFAEPSKFSASSDDKKFVKFMVSLLSPSVDVEPCYEASGGAAAVILIASSS